jgi:hypothetical protein
MSNSLPSLKKQISKNSAWSELNSAVVRCSFVTIRLPVRDRASGIHTDLPGTARVDAESIRDPRAREGFGNCDVVLADGGPRSGRKCADNLAAGGSHFFAG